MPSLTKLITLVYYNIQMHSRGIKSPDEVVKMVLRGLIVGVLGIFIGISLILSNNSLGSTVAGVSLIVLGMNKIFISRQIIRNAPPLKAYYIVGHPSIFFWVNELGIWKNKQLIFTWNEISDITPLPRKETKRTSLLGRLIKPIAYQSSSKILLILKNGAKIAIYVKDPDEVAKFIKEIYLRR